MCQDEVSFRMSSQAKRNDTTVGAEYAIVRTVKKLQDFPRHPINNVAAVAGLCNQTALSDWQQARRDICSFRAGQHGGRILGFVRDPGYLHQGAGLAAGRQFARAFRPRTVCDASANASRSFRQCGPPCASTCGFRGART